MGEDAIEAPDLGAPSRPGEVSLADDKVEPVVRQHHRMQHGAAEPRRLGRVERCVHGARLAQKVGQIHEPAQPFPAMAGAVDAEVKRQPLPGQRGDCGVAHTQRLALAPQRGEIPRQQVRMVGRPVVQLDRCAGSGVDVLRLLDPAPVRRDLARRQRAERAPIPGAGEDRVGLAKAIRIDQEIDVAPAAHGGIAVELG